MAAVNPLPALGISLGNELAIAAERLRSVTVRVHGADQGCGSGVIWNRNGMIVTNAHVARVAQYEVELADGRVCQANVVRRDPGHDLAILVMTARGIEPAEVRDVTTLRTGELVLAVGSPMGVAGAFS